MQTYVCSVSATSNSTPDTEDVFIEFLNSISSVQRIRKITVTCEPESFTGVTKIRFKHTSSAGATGVNGSITKKQDSRNDASVGSGLKVKNGTAAFTAGTSVEDYGVWAVNGKLPFVWQAYDFKDEITLLANRALCVMISSSSASIVYTVTIEWEEVYYIAINVEATTNATPGTEDQFIACVPAAYQSHNLKRLRVCPKSATDAKITVRFVRMSTSGSGYVAGTPVKKHPSLDRLGGATWRIKNGVTDAPPGTVDKVFDRFAINGRDYQEWIAADDDQEVYGYNGATFAILISATQASIPMRVQLEAEF